MPKPMLKLVRKEEEEDRGAEAPVLLGPRTGLLLLLRRLGSKSRGYALAGVGVVAGAVVVVSLLSWLAPDSDRPIASPLEAVGRVAGGVLEQVDDQVEALLGTEGETALRSVREGLAAAGSATPWPDKSSEVAVGPPSNSSNNNNNNNNSNSSTASPDSTSPMRDDAAASTRGESPSTASETPSQPALAPSPSAASETPPPTTGAPSPTTGEPTPPPETPDQPPAVEEPSPPATEEPPSTEEPPPPTEEPPPVTEEPPLVVPDPAPVKGPPETLADE